MGKGTRDSIRWRRLGRGFNRAIKMEREATTPAQDRYAREVERYFTDTDRGVAPGSFRDRLTTLMSTVITEDRFVLDLTAEERHLLVIGAQMEEDVTLLQSVNDEVTRSKQILQDLENQVGALHDLVAPRLLKIATDLRDSRMTVVRELNEALGAFRGVRNFLLDKEHERQMAQLDRFLGLCREFEALRQAGAIDAMLRAIRPPAEGSTP